MEYYVNNSLGEDEVTARSLRQLRRLGVRQAADKARNIHLCAVSSALRRKVRLPGILQQNPLFKT